MLTSLLKRTGLLPRPSVRDEVRAAMHLHAVLGALPHLVRLDAAAATLARAMGKVALRFQVVAGPSVVLAFDNGRVTVRRCGKAAVTLLFPSCQALNRMFDGENVVPLPVGNLLMHMGALKQFPKLTDRLTAFLKPAPGALDDPTFRAHHVELSLLVGLMASGDLAALDPKVARVANELHDGTIQYEVVGGPTAHLRIANKVISAGAGPVADPTTTITIRDIDLALGLIQGTVDTFAANGSGAIRASGDLHFADAYNNLFDRVGFYLK